MWHPLRRKNCNFPTSKHPLKRQVFQIQHVGNGDKDADKSVVSSSMNLPTQFSIVVFT